MSEFYTYFHTRNDTNKVFYVGKGKGRRAHESGRNSHWDRIVAKHGYTVHFAMTGLSEAEAFEHEKFLILCFKDMNVELVNMTDGGEGASGWIPSQAFRSMVSRTHKGKVTPAETRKKMSVSMRKANAAPEVKAKRVAAWTDERKAEASERGKHLIFNAIQANIGAPSHMLGKKHSEEAKAKISEASSGENNPMFGKTFNHTDEAKAKIAKASKNRVVTPEARSNISVAAKAGWITRRLKQNRA